jgi:hypothetical protein
VGWRPEGFQVRVTALALGTALTPDGVVGTSPRATTGAEADDGADVPAALVACTVNAYDDPSFRPVTVAELRVPETTVVAPPGEVVTV